MSLAATLQRQGFYETSAFEDDIYYITGNTGCHGVDFCVGMKLFVDEGQVNTIGEHITANHCSTCTLLITAATTYRYANPVKQVVDTLRQCSALSYDDLKKDHIREYQSYYYRMTFELEEEESDQCYDITQRFQHFCEQPTDTALVNAYVNYGR